MSKHKHGVVEDPQQVKNRLLYEVARLNHESFAHSMRGGTKQLAGCPHPICEAVREVLNVDVMNNITDADLMFGGEKTWNEIGDRLEKEGLKIG